MSCETDSLEIKTSDHKMLCPEALIFGFLKKRKMIDRRNTVPRGNLIPYETLEYTEGRKK